MPDNQWPLLHRNAQGLAEANDPNVKARLLADRVGLLARHGFGSHAIALLPEARDAVLELDDSEAFVRLAISESIASYYSGMPHSPDVFDTALDAARAHRMPDLAAEAAVWAATFPGTSASATALSSASRSRTPTCTRAGRRHLPCSWSHACDRARRSVRIIELA